ncbi:MAG: ComEC/Rec2 family competence protein, partial [Alphaproteobacteria bacterium]|nr:ComEC/Rec2 family competence protein [Alphaproteobacteria bacterium]
AISDDTLQAMRASGLQHILSISGLHLAVVAALCFVFLRQLLACVPFLALNFPIKKWAAAGALLSIVVYTWLTGAQIPTLRAMLMAGVVFVAVMADRRALTLRTLALAAILLLIIKPFALYSASFQLSFAAMLALLAWYERSGKNPPRGLWQKIGLFFAGLLITSLLATMATAPLTLYHFQQFSLYGVLANVVGVPLTTFIIMPAALLVYVLQPLGLHAWALAIMGWGVDILMIIATAVAALPHAMMTHSAPPPVVLPLLVAGGLWIGIWQTFWRWWGIFPIVIAGLITGLHTPPNFYAAEGGKVWALYHQPTHTLYFSGARHDSFIITQWWQRWGRPARITATQAPDDVLICHDGLCRTRMQALPPPHNWLAMPATADALKVACGRAHTLITPQAVDAAAPCQAAHALDETFFSAHNNVSLSWADGRLIITPSPLHHRPWSYNK